MQVEVKDETLEIKKENKQMKVTGINAYIKVVDGKQHEFVAIKFDNGETVFINTGLLVYAIKNAKPVKQKESK